MTAHDDLVATAEAAADRAGAIIRAWFRTGPTADIKPDRSPVTVADRDAERAIRDTIETRHPDHSVLGEEGGPSGGGYPGRGLWLVDPIDGTRAFITGRLTFGTLIAFVENGVPVLGLIDQPITGERWIGVRGRPTRFRNPLGGNPGVRRCAALADAELSATSPDMFTPDSRPRFDRLAAAVRRTSWGGDCYAYGLLALGQLDIVAEATMKPWDWAALVPIVEGAGGTVTDWQGHPLRLQERLDEQGSSGEVLATSGPGLLAQATALLGTHEEVTV